MEKTFALLYFVRYIYLFAFLEHNHKSNKMEKHVHIALERFNKNTGINLSYEEINKTPQIRVLFGKSEIVIPAFVTGEIRKTNLPDILRKLNERPETFIIAKKTYPFIRDFFKQKNINYVDQDGYARLFAEGLAIMVKEKGEEIERRQVSGRAFTKTGLKVSYHFLRYPETLNFTMREIAKSTGVGLDTVYNVIKDLEEQDLIIQESTGHYIYNDRKIIYDKWIEQYEIKLKPSIHLGRFSFGDKKRNWKDIKLPGDSVWGGEPAASLISGSLIPQVLTVYSDLHLKLMIDNLKIKSDKGGPIVLNKKFWLYEPTFIKTTHPLLVYADLIHTRATRNHEIAATIYQEHLIDLIEQ